jgi:heme o synthase
MVLAARGVPPLWLIAATLGGGALVAGCANTLNCYLERDIDAVMSRTSRRPLARSVVPPAHALVVALGLGIVGTVLLAVVVNVLTAVLTAAAAVFYVGVYTIGLKRRTPQNIVIGGAAGCVPVLAGWSAVTGELALPALVLFLIVFLWTPPHFWALAVKHRREYAAADVPMLPVVVGVAETTRRMTRYTVALIAASLLLAPVANLGPIYVASATILGAVFIAGAVRLSRSRSEREAMRLFRYSITYLTLLFAALALDVLISG